MLLNQLGQLHRKHDMQILRAGYQNQLTAARPEIITSHGLFETGGKNCVHLPSVGEQTAN